MKQDTFICDTCKRAIDLTINPFGVTAFPRCVITKNCRGLLSRVNKLFVADEQYHASGTSSDAWFQLPMIYNHDQNGPRRVWTFSHNLGTQPILNVYLYDANGKLSLATTKDFSIVTLNNTNAVLSFPAACTGVVQCVVRQSATQSSIETASQTAPIEYTQLMYNQVIVLATKLSSLTSLSVSINANQSKVINLPIDTNLMSSTPWSDVTSVVINNITYNVVGIDASALNMGTNAVSSFWFSSVNGQIPVRGDTYVLLAKQPYQHKVDKMLSNVVDLALITPTTQNLTSLVGSTLYCDPKLVASVYPPMEVHE